MTVPCNEVTLDQPTGNFCFAISPASDAISSRLARLFDELYLPAIVDAGFSIFTPPVNPATPLSASTMREQIAAARVFFADLSEPTPNLWFALGCALALHKPLCLVVATSGAASGSHDAVPSPLASFGDVIPYPRSPFPSDYQVLRQSITDRLRHALTQSSQLSQLSQLSESFQSFQSSQPTLPHATPSHIPEPSAAAYASFNQDTTFLQQPAAASASEATTIAPPANALAAAVKDIVLKSYEVVALKYIASNLSPSGTSPRALAQEMQKFGLVQVTSIAINSLRRRQFIHRPLTHSGDVESADNLVATSVGKTWLNSKRAASTFRIDPIAAAPEPETLIDVLATL